MTRHGWEWVEPEDVFVAHVAHRERSWWLDGCGSRPWSGRMTYLGWLEPGDVSITYHSATGVTGHGSAWGDGKSVGSSIFGQLEACTGLPSPPGGPTGWERSTGWVGYVGYASRLDLPATTDDDPQALDACWLRAERRIAFDHARRRVYAVCPPENAADWEAEVGRLLEMTPTADPPGDPPPALMIATWSRRDYAEAFDRVQEQLRRGNSYEVNLTFQTGVRSQADPVDVYRRLRASSPAPYAALITHRGTRVLSSSPERFATISADGMIETRPIKGTTPRDLDPARDRAAAERLRQEPKFVGENLMVVDLLRNDMARVCQPGTVRVTDLMHVESYPSVHQLVTTIEGRLHEGIGTVRALWTLFPGGSMTGAPKLRTMQIIADVESTPRGVYAGAIGWILDDNSADLGVVIRTLVHRDGLYTFGTGGGITVRSEADEEYAETAWKARTLLGALGIRD